VGTRLPDFHLRNQDDQPLRMQDLRGRAVLVTFIYTRCPLPDYCPRIMRQLDAVKQAIDAVPDVRLRVHLVAVSLDPAFDTPAVLRAYGERYISGLEKFSRLDLATGTSAEVQALAGFFGVNYVDERGQISHALATAVIGSDGRVVSVLRGNTWHPDDAIAALVSEARATK
jgi:protein SCO1/2